MTDWAALRKAHVDAFMAGNHDEYVRTWLLLEKALNRTRTQARSGEGKKYHIWLRQKWKSRQKHKHLERKENQACYSPISFGS